MSDVHTPAQDAGGDATREFLLQEYAAAEADTQRLRQEGATRLNILVVIIGAASAAATSIATSDKLGSQAKESIGLGIFASILIYTLLCYKNFIDREITTDSNFRALSRIRRYFVDRYPPVARHVSWDTSDGPTHQLTNNRSFILAVVRHIVGVEVAVATAVRVHVSGLGDVANGFVTAGAYALSVLALWVWSRRRFRIAIDRASSHARFPVAADRDRPSTPKQPAAKEQSKT